MNPLQYNFNDFVQEERRQRAQAARLAVVSLGAPSGPVAAAIALDATKQRMRTPTAAVLVRWGMRCVAAVVIAFAIGFTAGAYAQSVPSPATAPASAAAPSLATPAQPLPSVNVGQIGNQPVSMPMQVLLLMTGITLLPALLLGVTAFTRVIIVLGLLRQALGTGQAPSNQVLLALALFLTAMIMQPVFDHAWTAGIAPYLDHQMDFRSAWAGASGPFREFMLAQVRESDLMTFAGLSNSGPYATPQDVPFGVLAASFLTSELKTAFEIAFLIYIPFVIIDLVVASVLMSMGMMMLSPMIISAPFKILLFVLVDGWVLVVGSLAGSFNPVA